MLSLLDHAPPVSCDILIHWRQGKKGASREKKGERVDEFILCPSISRLIPWPSLHESIKATMTEDTVHPDKVWELEVGVIQMENLYDSSIMGYGSLNLCSLTKIIILYQNRLSENCRQNVLCRRKPWFH